MDNVDRNVDGRRFRGAGRREKNKYNVGDKGGDGEYEGRNIPEA